MTGKSILGCLSVAAGVAAVGCGDTSAPGGAVRAVDNAGSTGEQVRSPDYSVDFGSLAVQTDMSQVVTTATGTLGLIESLQGGESYVIDTDEALGSTFASIDVAYTARSPFAVSPTIPVESFTLMDRTLPTVRNLIIVHAVDGVKAYQVIRVTFAGATW